MEKPYNFYGLVSFWKSLTGGELREGFLKHPAPNFSGQFLRKNVFKLVPIIFSTTLSPGIYILI